ncbi:hypothetical protein QOZ80_5BG0417380 [Eleusine coracana subsp. coracana]|nr:hypothetical protein QOZ80_5BG0417380 [Eleusine coracana subsp. coracana]
MGSRRRRFPALWFLFPLLMTFELCASLNQGADPHGSLFDWDEGDASPCSWFRVECPDDGRVMTLNMGSAASRKLLESKQKDSLKNKVDGPGTPTFASSVSNFEEPAIVYPPSPPFQNHPSKLQAKRMGAGTTATEGITLFRLSQLEKACEGFCNIIGSLPGCTLYKGTLPCGAEIAVVSTSVAYAGGWSPTTEAHFKNKVEILSMVNHKNLMNLVGYCEDEEPFTRIMVFEYVSNGSLFERLHVKEAEHLNWQARLRIAMGVIYCLDYLHLQSPPVNLRDINSSCIYLTEDNAAKVSDMSFCSGKKEGDDELDASDECSTVYKFALLLLETISGRRPYSEDDGLLALWAHRYLTGVHPVMGMVDPTLNSVPEEQVRALSELIRSCISEDPRLRPTIAEVNKRMQDITGITQDQAVPRNSDLWWAELEIITE